VQLKKGRQEISKWTCILTVVVSLSAFVEQAGAYCVHNNTDRSVTVDQTSNASSWEFKRFSKDLGPNTSECCNWSNPDCNKSGGKYDVVGFTVSIACKDFESCGCSSAQIPACSDLYFEGSKGNYKCVPHGAETCN